MLLWQDAIVPGRATEWLKSINPSRISSHSLIPGYRTRKPLDRGAGFGAGAIGRRSQVSGSCRRYRRAEDARHPDRRRRGNQHRRHRGGGVRAGVGPCGNCANPCGGVQSPALFGFRGPTNSTVFRARLCENAWPLLWGYRHRGFADTAVLRLDEPDRGSRPSIERGGGDVAPSYIGRAGICLPIVEQNAVYVDGGVLNNMPTDVIRDFGVASAIAVDVGTRWKARRASMAKWVCRTSGSCCGEWVLSEVTRRRPGYDAMATLCSSPRWATSGYLTGMPMNG